MNGLRRLMLTTLLVAGTASSQTTVSLDLQPETTLPGLPVALALTVANTSPSTVVLANGVNVEVTAADGTSFFATWDGRTSVPFPAEIARDLSVPSSGTRELYLPLEPTLAGPEIFNDRRLSQPGTYHLRAHLYELHGDGSTTSVTSDSTALHVRAPQGADAAAWSLLLSARPDGWTPGDWVTDGPAVATRILAHYPHSRYAAYAVLVYPARTHDERLDGIARVLADNPGGPVADLLALVRASVYTLRSNEAFGRGDLEKSADDARKAKAAFVSLLRSSYGFVRDAAKAAIPRVKDPDRIRALFEAIHASDPPALLPVVPLIDCVDQTSKGLLVRFGYNNPNAAGKVIQPGSANRFFPGVPDRGQPRYFVPGRHEGVISGVTQGGQTLTWILDGVEASVAANTPSCAGTAVLPIRPMLECVRHENQGAVATFGYDNPNRVAVVIEIGERNRFEHNADSGQPGVFLAGRHTDVFKVNVKDSGVTWTLDGTSVSSSARSPVVCLQQ